MGVTDDKNVEVPGITAAELKKYRTEYSRNADRYKAILSFLDLYSDPATPLSDNLKNLFRVCGGHPIQDVLYSTVIYNIAVEKWPTYTIRERRKILLDKGAELYNLQRKLNICIGRTYYETSRIDISLIWHIKDEIEERFDFMREDFSAMERDGYSYPENLFTMYNFVYTNNKVSMDSFLNRETYYFENAARVFFNRNKERNDHIIKDEQTFWTSVTGKRTKSSVTKFTQVMRDKFGRRLYPTKDDLYVFAIAVKLSYEDFLYLVEEAKRDCDDPSPYTLETGSLRDAMLISVIRDIDRWYSEVLADISNTEVQEANPDSRKAVKGKKEPFPGNLIMEILFRVDKMLWENLCYNREKPQLENLLYHSFLVDRGSKDYTDLFNEWAEKNNDNVNYLFDILDFQAEAKRELQKVREETVGKISTKRFVQKQV